MILRRLKPIAKLVLPAQFRLWLKTTGVRVSERPAYKCVDFGSFRRTTPIHEGFEVGRGTYIDRYYIDRFLQENSQSVRGRVLELASNAYTRRFGGSNVTHSDILDVREDHPEATIVADLCAPQSLPAASFDCIILTQTLNCIYDVRAAIRSVYQALKPGGCVLVSVPGIAQFAPMEMEYCGEFWRFTSLSVRRLFEEVFPPSLITVRAEGNVLAAVGFLHGLAAEELEREELDYRDPYYEVSILLKAVRPE